MVVVALVPTVQSLFFTFMYFTRCVLLLWSTVCVTNFRWCRIWCERQWLEKSTLFSYPGVPHVSRAVRSLFADKRWTGEFVEYHPIPWRVLHGLSSTWRTNLETRIRCYAIVYRKIQHTDSYDVYTHRYASRKYFNSSTWCATRV